MPGMSWNESDHPRHIDGKFREKTGSKPETELSGGDRTPPTDPPARRRPCPNPSVVPSGALPSKSQRRSSRTRPSTWSTVTARRTCWTHATSWLSPPAKRSASPSAADPRSSASTRRLHGGGIFQWMDAKAQAWVRGLRVKPPAGPGTYNWIALCRRPHVAEAAGETSCQSAAPSSRVPAYMRGMKRGRKVLTLFFALSLSLVCAVSSNVEPIVSAPGTAPTAVVLSRVSTAARHISTAVGALTSAVDSKPRLSQSAIALAKKRVGCGPQDLVAEGLGPSRRRAPSWNP